MIWTLPKQFVATAGSSGAIDAEIKCCRLFVGRPRQEIGCAGFDVSLLDLDRTLHLRFGICIRDKDSCMIAIVIIVDGEM